MQRHLLSSRHLESTSTRCQAIVERGPPRRIHPSAPQLYDSATRTGEGPPSTSAASEIGTALTLMRLERSLGRESSFLWLPSVLMSSPITEPPPTKGKKDERPPDYFANVRNAILLCMRCMVDSHNPSTLHLSPQVGDAIRTLRDDIPHLFDRDLNCKE